MREEEVIGKGGEEERGKKEVRVDGRERVGGREGTKAGSEGRREQKGDKKKVSYVGQTRLTVQYFTFHSFYVSV